MAMPNWISVDPHSGGSRTEVSVSASGNIGTSLRNGTITVKASSGITKTISLMQDGRELIDIIVGGNSGYLTKMSV